MRTDVLRQLPLLAVVTLTSCLAPTPFGSDPDEHDLNASNLSRLAKSPPRDPLRFVVLGDTHDAYDDLRETVDHLNVLDDVDFVLHVGDLTNLGLLQEFEWTQRVLSRLARPVVVLLGNHDAISSGKEIYRDMYGPTDFAFARGGKKFVVFNSNSLEFPGAPDRAWLESELAPQQGTAEVLLFTHQNPRSPDEPAGAGGAAFYESLLMRHEVSLIVHGHVKDFAYEPWSSTFVLASGTFQKTKSYVVVSVDQSSISVELCRFGACQQQRPSEP